MPQRPSSYQNCQLCLMGQTADEIGLQTFSIANLTACLQEESISRTLRDAVTDATYKEKKQMLEIKECGEGEQEW